MQTERAPRHMQARLSSTYLLAKTPPLMMCAFFPHLGPHIYLNVKCLFFKVLLLHTSLINPTVLTLALHLGPYINNYRVNIVQHKLHIVRTEDRLFDRGWVRSAMATRKCGNIYFPKYFMAVRPFFTRNLFQELFGLEGSKTLLKNFVRCTI